MSKKLDKETEKVLGDGEALKELIVSKGWGIARSKLLEKVARLVNMMDITTPDPSTIVPVLIGRQEAAKILTEWLRDIEATVEQHKANTDYFNQIKEETYILHIAE